MTRLPEPHDSRAILIGTSHYRSELLENIPQVEHNIADLAAVLTDPSLGGLAKEACLPLLDPDNPGNLGEQIRDFAMQARDTLILYFSGHGWPDDKDELYLTLPSTKPELLIFTALPFEWIRRICYNSPARNKVIVLDCCFSGLATEILQLAGDDPAIAGQVNIEGAFVMASSAATRTSKVLPKERNTAFSGELIKLLRDGVPEDASLISLDSLYIHLARRLEIRKLPIPQKIGTGTTDRLALSRNISQVAEVIGSAVLYDEDEDLDEKFGSAARLIAVGSILKSFSTKWEDTFPRAPLIEYIDEFPSETKYHGSDPGYSCWHDGESFRRRACSDAADSWSRFTQYLDNVGQFCLGVKYEYGGEDPLRQLRLQLPGWNQFISSRDELADRMAKYLDDKDAGYRLFPAHFNDGLARLVADVETFLRENYRALPKNPQYPPMPRLALTRKRMRQHFDETWSTFVFYLGEGADFCNIPIASNDFDGVLDHLTKYIVSFSPFANRVRDVRKETEKILNSDLGRRELRQEAVSLTDTLTQLGSEIESYLRLLLAEGHV